MTYRELLTTVNDLKDELKARSRVFAIDAKEAAAHTFGLPSDFYYDYFYKEWSKAAERHRFLLDEMHRQIKLYEKWETPEILEKLGDGRPIENIPFSKWARRFLIYRADRKRPIAPYTSQRSQ
jgi:hypothetical protein